ncbi:hypothetical protein KKC67_00955 [Patescibacteria group bacterium]|nr:hypothetical protein [Patescibacteria group bacterium]MBU0879451.1 hypothetical protein [Patescibacteria group bacterium]MBU0897921.1 hypothetical protein [Patescibacteria group bacterium]MBU1063153.1 hypothetical protein [Patescibacteria group bacterium]MBU1783313.1 hypothetical protein [Patescibacteria group bacterium]
MGNILYPKFPDHRQKNLVENKRDKNDKFKEGGIEYFEKFEKSKEHGELLGLHITLDSYLKMYNEIKECATHQLIGWLKEKHENGIIKDPAFLKAIVFELKARINKEKEKIELSDK